MVVEDVSFTNSRGQKLAGVLRYTEPIEPTKYPVVIVLHGFASHKHHGLTADIANNLVHFGFLTLRFDFHGHGESEGEFSEHTIHQQVDDVFAALDFVSGLEFADKDRILVVGTDIGGNIALLAAEKDARIKAVITQGARSHLDKHINGFLQPHELKELMTKGFFAHSDFDIRKEYVHSARQHDVLESIGKVYVPVLLVHGEDDMRVRIEETRQMFLAANNPKQILIVPGADHWFRGPVREQLYAEIAQWGRRWVR